MRKKKICLLCGRVFIPQEKAQLYCSKACSYEAKLKHRRERRKEMMVRMKLSDNMHMISQINQQARDIGMCYGQYVARYGANLNQKA